MAINAPNLRLFPLGFLRLVGDAIVLKAIKFYDRVSCIEIVLIMLCRRLKQIMHSFNPPLNVCVNHTVQYLKLQIKRFAEF